MKHYFENKKQNKKILFSLISPNILCKLIKDIYSQLEYCHSTIYSTRVPRHCTHSYIILTLFFFGTLYIILTHNFYFHHILMVVNKNMAQLKLPSHTMINFVIKLCYSNFYIMWCFIVIICIIILIHYIMV